MRTKRRKKTQEAADLAAAAPRPGRPPADLAGEVDARILQAATSVFLERGYEGASVERIAEVARAGKATIYGRYRSKEAIFISVVEYAVRRVLNPDAFVSGNGSIENGLATLGSTLNRRILADDVIALIRLMIAEAPRFPDLARTVDQRAHTIVTAEVSMLLQKIAASERFAVLLDVDESELVTLTENFIALVILPLEQRALMGEDIATVRADVDRHVARAVDFFISALKAGRAGHGARQDMMAARANNLKNKRTVGVGSNPGGSAR
jgi:AcrR family transcriptional regulator